MAEYDALPANSGERGALLRREGPYSSNITEWRRQAEAGVLDGLTRTARTPKRTREEVELDKLQTRNARLQAELDKTRLALEITGKAHALLELISERAYTDKPSRP